MKQKYIDLYMDWAKRTAELSHARRLKVGAVIVKEDSVISYGYNGMPSGWDNDCEHKVYDWQKDMAGNYFPHSREEYPHDDKHGRYKLKTNPEVLHAESNAVSKLAKSHNSGDWASIFITHSPCIECAKLIYQAGIRGVYYGEDYRTDAGINFLTKSGIKVTKVEKAP